MARPIIAGKLPVKTGGFTYLLVLGFVAIVLLSLTITSEHVALTQQREREAELIFIGQQYQAAIGSYYNQSPNGVSTFPGSLDELLNDRRSQVVKHHLRKLYRDPMLNTNEWGLVKDAFGKISGVYSLSKQKPIKTNVDFVKTTSSVVNNYGDWQFVFVPQVNTLNTGERDSSASEQPSAALLE